MNETAATVIIGQRVRPGLEQEFAAWQHEVNKTASRYPGFLGAEVTAPTAVQPDWVVVYRFDTVANVQAWINSATRQTLVAVGRQFLDGPSTQQVVGGAAKPTDQLVTVVVSHRVNSENVEEFLALQERFRLAEQQFDGFRGSELFRPIEGVQDEWTTIYRYDNAANLDTWLISPERQALLTQGKRFSEFSSRTVDNSFGSWFAFDERGDRENAAPAPSETKTSIAVWVGLYPTVVILTLLLSPLKMPLWLSMLIGNLLSSFVMSFVTMPYYVNPLLKRWLRPPPNAPVSSTNWRGFGLVVALMAAWTLIIYLVTQRFWQLP